MKIEGKGRRKLHKQDEKNLKIRQIEEKDQQRKKRKPTKENKGRPPGTRVMRMTMMKMFFVWYVTYMTPFKIQLTRWFLRCSAMGVSPGVILAVQNWKKTMFQIAGSA